jgi:hypothetical protein
MPGTQSTAAPPPPCHSSDCIDRRYSIPWRINANGTEYRCTHRLHAASSDCINRRYADLAIGVSAAKRGSPSAAVRAATLVGPASAANLGGAGGAIDFVFLRYLIGAGALVGFDAVSVHAYSAAEPETRTAEYAQLRALMDNAGLRSTAIVSGEWGYSTCHRFGEFDARAVYGPRSYLTCIELHHVPKNRRDKPDSPALCATSGAASGANSRRDQAKFLARSWLVNALSDVNVSAGTRASARASASASARASAGASVSASARASARASASASARASAGASASASAWSEVAASAGVRLCGCEWDCACVTSCYQHAAAELYSRQRPQRGGSCSVRATPSRVQPCSCWRLVLTCTCADACAGLDLVRLRGRRRQRRRQQHEPVRRRGELRASPAQVLQ